MNEHEPNALRSLSSLEENALAPMVELLEDELQVAGVPVPAGKSSDGGRGFSLWYLQVVQTLEAYVAQADAHAPMSRGDVELMCRCALSATTLGEAIRLIEQFCAMLYPRAGELPVQQIAQRLGFQDADSFRRAFRRWTGTSPSAWRSANIH